jgi:hypothetical protein
MQVSTSRRKSLPDSDFHCKVNENKQRTQGFSHFSKRNYGIGASNEYKNLRRFVLAEGNACV